MAVVVGVAVGVGVAVVVGVAAAAGSSAEAKSWNTAVMGVDAGNAPRLARIPAKVATSVRGDGLRAEPSMKFAGRSSRPTGTGASAPI
ncbi:hypothetical protein BJQ89_03457 [Arthrobacter sp. ES1]|nr:hypothetical protein [Arthrobacter sp. ES1]